MIFKRLDHIAFRVSDMKTVVDFYARQLGFQVVQELDMEIAGSRAISRVLKLPGNPFFIFVDQGLEEKNIISQWVKKHGSGLHHMAYLVDAIDVAAEQLRGQGIKFTTQEVIDTGGGLRQLFTHPNPVTGIITEIIQRDKKDLFFVQENVVQLIQSTEGL